MPAQLRPLSTVQLLDAAWLALRRNWLLLYACSGVGTAPLAISIMLYFLWLGRIVQGTSNAYFYSGTVLWAVAMTGSWALNSVARGAVTHLVLADARGEPVDLGAAWRSAGRHALGGAFLGLFTFAAMGLGLTCLAPAVLLALGWWVARPTLLVEERPNLAALRRSWKLTDGYRSHAFGLWGLFVLLWGFGFLNCHLLAQAALGVASGLLGIDTSGVQQVLVFKNQAYSIFILTILFVLLDPLKTAADAFLYLDLRVRREGADLQERLRALQAGSVAALLVLLLAVPAGAVPLDDYVTRVRELRQAVERADSGEQVDPATVNAVRNQLVQMPGGQKVDAGNDWLRSGFRNKEEKQAVLDRLGTLERSLVGAGGTVPKAEQSPAPSTTGVDTKEALQRIMQEPEFQPLADRPELRNIAKRLDVSKAKSWWDGFVDWISKRLFRPNPPRVEAPRTNVKPPTVPLDVLKVVLYVLAGAVVLLVLALLVRWFLERPQGKTARAAAAPAKAPPLEASATENALDHTVDEWEQFARQWLSQGDMRQAIRALYLATLVHLHRERRIDYNKAHTNWMYVRNFHGEAEHQGVLSQLTRMFDEVWYGDRAYGSEQYYTFERGVRQLGTPAPVQQ